MIKNFNFIVIVLIITMTMFQGVVRLAGFPNILYDFLIDIIIIMFFIYNIKYINIKKIPGILYFLFFVIVILISSIINESNIVIVASFARNTIIPFIFFSTIIFAKIKYTHLLSLNKIIVLIVFIQIIAAILKYIVYNGPREGGFIGTFSISAGQMSTLFPMFIIIVATYYILIYKRLNIYYVTILGMMFFAYGGGKRAFIILLPFFFIIIYLMYRKYEKKISMWSISNIAKIGIPIFFVIPIFILYAMYTPSLNPERTVGGSFNINHIIEYADRYHTHEHMADGSRFGYSGQLISGRTHSRQYAFELISEDYKSLLLGFGPSLVHGAPRGDSRLLDLGVLDFHTGISQYYMAVGIIGSLLLIMIYFSVSIPMLKYYYSYSHYWRPLVLSLPTLFILFLFDFTNYSQHFAHGYVPSILYFYIAGILLNIKSRLLR